MSIRLKLTLLYSTILTLTLMIFGVALYSIQAQETLNSLKEDMVISIMRLKNPAMDIFLGEPPLNPDNQNSPPPKRFDEFLDGSAFQDIREREIVRILDSTFTLIASPYGKIEDALPLSEEGKIALQDQTDWWEEGIVADEQMLIFSRPVIDDGEISFIVQIARSLTERNRTLRSLATTLSIAGGIIVVFAFGIGWMISGFTLRPIHRITMTAKKIGDKRDFSRRVDHEGPQDEIGQLASTFNEMLTKLEEAYNKVEKALDQQREFIADVSHELRTPLTTILGNLALMRRAPSIPDDDQEDVLNDMVEESNRLIRLVNDLLTLAHADARQKIKMRITDVSSVLDECIREVSHLNRNRNINSKIFPELIMLGSKDALKQIFLILIDNAIKYSSGNIEISATEADENIYISFQDQGKGIPLHEKKHIFERFYRGKDRSKDEGFGLGLPIAKALTREMDGEIAVESNVGQGSTFIVQFPIYKSE